MLILKNLGISIEYAYSLSDKRTARCPEQFIGYDKDRNLYLVIYAKEPTQIFYAKRAAEQQSIFQKILPDGIKCNCPVYCAMHDDGFYAVYHYYRDVAETRGEFPDKWIRTLYKTCSKEYEVTPTLIAQIEKAFLSAWPLEFHSLIVKLQAFTEFHNALGEHKSLQVCFQHGDYTPNNILQIGADIYLMDFEFAVEFQPIGFDLFDYHYASDQIYIDIPYLKINKIKEKLINEINALIDNFYQPTITNQHDNELTMASSWADDMIYNRPDLYEKNIYTINIKYGKKVYRMYYTIKRYKAELYVWLRNIPLSVLNYTADYILHKHKYILKLEINYALSNIKNALNSTNNWVVFLPDHPNEILERLSNKSRYNFKREKRLLTEQCGEIRINEYDNLNIIPAEIFDVYFEWKKETHGTEYGISGTDYIKKYHVNGAMLLTAGGSPVAVLLYCLNGGTVYLENISYHQQYKKCSPGIILYEHFLEQMTLNGIKCVFLNGGNQSYKARFDSKEYLVYSGNIYRNRAVKTLNMLKRKIIK